MGGSQNRTKWLWRSGIFILPSVFNVLSFDRTSDCVRKIALQVMKEIGYDEEYHVLVKVNKQSSEINGAVAHDEISAVRAR